MHNTHTHTLNDAAARSLGWLVFARANESVWARAWHSNELKLAWRLHYESERQFDWLHEQRQRLSSPSSMCTSNKAHVAVVVVVARIQASVHLHWPLKRSLALSSCLLARFLTFAHTSSPFSPSSSFSLSLSLSRCYIEQQVGSLSLASARKSFHLLSVC